MRTRVSALSSRGRKSAALGLAFAWILGTALGIGYACGCEITLLPLMRGILISPVSIVSFLCVSLLPFVLSAILAFFDCSWAVYGVCFGKAFLHGLVSTELVTCFPDWGWLARCCLLCSDAALPLLYWFWLRCVQRRPLLPAAPIVLLGQLAVTGFGYYRMLPIYWRVIESMKG